jgi:Ca-activated chloride channel family protein
MNVANILPGDEIVVELKYTELLVPEDRVYEFVYPTVVGPRYSNTPAEQALLRNNGEQIPYLHSGESRPMLSTSRSIWQPVCLSVTSPAPLTR